MRDCGRKGADGTKNSPLCEICRDFPRIGENCRDLARCRSREISHGSRSILAKSRLETRTIARIAGDAPLARIFHMGTRKRMVRQPVLGCTAYGVPASAGRVLRIEAGSIICEIQGEPASDR